MRHLGSIVLAIVFAPLIYILAGVGQVKFVAGTAGASTDWAAVGIGIGALVVAALLYSVLVMTRISPLGPIIAAALLIAVELWAVFDQAGLVDKLGASTLGVHGAQEAPLSGLALFIAVPLIVTIVSPRRWRGTDKPVTVYGSTTSIYGTPGSAAPTYAPLQTSADTAADSTADSDAEETAEETAEDRADESADATVAADSTAAEKSGGESADKD
jgi:hypothetical protein